MNMREAVAYAHAMEVKLIPYELAENMGHTKEILEAVKPGDGYCGLYRAGGWLRTGGDRTGDGGRDRAGDAGQAHTADGDCGTDCFVMVDVSLGILMTYHRI